jgi:uncharacterized membrane protein YeaQ/YmgE (transglycosylase-associated protein family)
MSWILAIIAGIIVGWIANAIMRTRANIWTDLIVGIIGSVIGRWFFGSVLGIGSALSAGTFSVLGLLWGVIGAVVLIAIVRAIMGAYREERTMGPSYHEEIRHKKDDNDKMSR